MTVGHPELEPIGGSGDFALFESTGAASGDYTQMGWEVDLSRRKSRLVQGQRRQPAGNRSADRVTARPLDHPHLDPGRPRRRAKRQEVAQRSGVVAETAPERVSR
jgi:hypothetical protein